MEQNKLTKIMKRSFSSYCNSENERTNTVNRRGSSISDQGSTFLNVTHLIRNLLKTQIIAKHHNSGQLNKEDIFHIINKNRRLVTILLM